MRKLPRDERWRNMAKAKAPKPLTNTGPIPWETNETDYPVINKGTCAVCNIKGTVKLAWDQHRYICVKAAPCLDRLKSNRKDADKLV